MIPKFLRPERFPFASFEFICAAAGLPVAAPVTVCAWCPDFDPTTQAPGLSHGMCQPCSDRLLEAERLADQDASDQMIFDAMKRAEEVETDDERRQADDDARDEQCGSTCSGQCGWCGRCS